MKATIEKIGEKLNISLELGGETYTETWEPNEFGWGAKGKDISSQIEEKLGELLTKDEDGEVADYEVAEEFQKLAEWLTSLNDANDIDPDILAWALR